MFFFLQDFILFNSNRFFTAILWYIGLHFETPLPQKGDMTPKPFRTLWSYPYRAQAQRYQNNSSIVIGSANPMVRGFLRFCYRQSSELGFVASPASNTV
jgi:hypothetical protein